MKLKLINSRKVFSSQPFDVEELDLAIDGKPLSHPYYRLCTPDWVNVLPITRDGKAILIKQERVGPFAPILETPGGVVDSGEDDVTRAALRELEEETGYTSRRIIPLASLNPNPAIQSNRCHYFMAFDCHVNETRTHFPDPEELIGVEIVDVRELENLVRLGRINHSLSALCVMLGLKYIKND
jgi:ADP-ribose pyrophosphatase